MGGTKYICLLAKYIISAMGANIFCFEKCQALSAFQGVTINLKLACKTSWSSTSLKK